MRRNRVYNNGAWGVVTVLFPDTGTPPPIAHCEGGTPNYLAGTFKCYFDDWGNEVAANQFSHNGFFGNPSNGDLGDVSDRHTPGNCWHGNTDPAGVTSAPANLQTTHAKCGAPNSGESIASPLATQLDLVTPELLAPCPQTVGKYPRLVKVVMPKLAKQKTTPSRAGGLANALCKRR